MSILDELAAHARTRVEAAKQIKSSDEIRAEALDLPRGTFALENAIRSAKERGDMAFICECKKASPSKGIIAENFPYLTIAKEYEAAGADAISVLTEPKWFLGADNYLSEITREVSVPCLRKDFTVDPYMIYEAKNLGASAVLLICAILTDEELLSYHRISDELGLSAIVETHDEEEIRRAIHAGARIIGVNNRNLKDFSVDTGNANRLRSLIPEDILFVSESGIQTPEDVSAAKASGADACLVGEALMRATDKKQALRSLRKVERPSSAKGNFT